MSHLAQPYETKPGVGFEAGRLLYRFPCSCGWRGCYYRTAEGAATSFSRHAAGMTIILSRVGAAK